jgi:hypothetical protein
MSEAGAASGVGPTTHQESSNRKCNYFSTFIILPLPLTIFCGYMEYMKHDERNTTLMEPLSLTEDILADLENVLDETPGVHMSFCLGNSRPALSLGIKSKSQDKVELFSNALRQAGFDYPIRGPYKDNFYECRTRNGVDRILDAVLPYLSKRREIASQLLAVYRDQLELYGEQSGRDSFTGPVTIWKYGY